VPNADASLVERVVVCLVILAARRYLASVGHAGVAQRTLLGSAVASVVSILAAHTPHYL
jgi:hypothetical protein